MKTAQDLIPNASSITMSGFNRRIYGENYNDIADSKPFTEIYCGWQKAEDMIAAGKIFYQHRFKCHCGSYPVTYGGGLCCNGCGQSYVQKPWWIIKVYKDGDAFVFMNMETYEQFPVPGSTVGKREVFLKENTEIDVLFGEGKALSIEFPKTAELKVASAPPPVKSGGDSNYREVEVGGRRKHPIQGRTRAP